MMKKIMAIVIVVAMLLTACGKKTKSAKKEKQRKQSDTQTEISVDLDSYTWEEVDVSQYFEEKSEVISVTSVLNSEKTQSEKEAVQELRNRGFDNCPIITEYTIDGELIESRNVSDMSAEKHPIYEAYFVTSENEIWIITLIDGTISATPSSYNFEHAGDVPVEVAESEEIASYDSTTNSIYLTVPKKEVLDVRVVDRIDAKTLESIELEG